MASAWTPDAKQEMAAALMAEAWLSDVKIAAKVGVSDTTIYNWRKIPEFKELIETQRAEQIAAARLLFITQKHNRLKVYDDHLRGLFTIRDERAEQYRTMNPEIPGGTSGLIVRTDKVIGTGAAAQKVTEHGIDKSLDAAIRDTMKQAAQEAGQWVEKGELTGKDGANLVPILEVVIDRTAKPERDSPTSEGVGE